VIATQNPTEQFGTFPLPESQLDRFYDENQHRYPSRDAEREILQMGSKREDIYLIEPVVNQEEAALIQNDILNSV
jgi:MoxR-like ATPase